MTTVNKDIIILFTVVTLNIGFIALFMLIEAGLPEYVSPLEFWVELKRSFQ